MSQRDSGYRRKKDDAYNTPEWVTETLLPHIPKRVKRIWEPAAGKGNMAAVLFQARYSVKLSDIRSGTDFLVSYDVADAIITNPPFKQAADFIEHALTVMRPCRGFVAMLGRVDYDSAKTRSHLFRECKAFSKKIVLTRRIIWFTPAIAAPSYNHAWYIWDWRHRGPPTISYSPSDKE